MFGHGNDLVLDVDCLDDSRPLVAPSVERVELGAQLFGAMKEPSQ